MGLGNSIPRQLTTECSLQIQDTGRYYATFCGRLYEWWHCSRKAPPNATGEIEMSFPISVKLTHRKVTRMNTNVRTHVEQFELGDQNILNLSALTFEGVNQTEAAIYFSKSLPYSLYNQDHLRVKFPKLPHRNRTTPSSGSTQSGTISFQRLPLLPVAGR